MSIGQRVMTVMLASTIAVGCGRTANVNVSVAPALTTEAPVFATRDAQGRHLWDLTKQFYEARANVPAWIKGGKPQPQMDQLIDALQHADREGLDPALYNTTTLTARRQPTGRGFLASKTFTAEESHNVDVWLTYLYLRYASDLAEGLPNLAHADPEWKLSSDKVDVLALLNQSLEHNRIGQSLAELTPAHAQYTRLRDVLQTYRGIERAGGWPTLPAMLKLKPGQQDAAVPLLAKRLSITGDLTGTAGSTDTTYGPALQEAVKRFQRRHGLTDDGVVSAATVAQMNVPVSQRIDQIALNLERWRWLPRDLGNRFVLVNIPEYRLEVWDHGAVPVSMRVVVGKTDTPTPIFDDTMTYVVFAPYWNVPTDIATKETIPSAMKDPAFLQRTHMDVLDRNGTVVDPSTIDLDHASGYRFRQRSGAGNSLGYAKFMFPNQYNVYLHDTPAGSLFARASRSFSHGCVRIAEPQKLAEYVLADQPAWTPERITETMHGGEETSVRLKAPLPVYIGYWTARVSADGLVQFRNDPYGIDGRQAALMAATLEKLKTRADATAVALNREAPVSGSLVASRLSR